MAPTCGCTRTLDHMDLRRESRRLHREARRVSRGTNLNDSHVEEIVLKLIFLEWDDRKMNKALCSLEPLAFFKSVMRTINQRTIDGTLGFRDFVHVFKMLYGNICRLGIPYFTSDLENGPRCSISELISKSLNEIITLLEKHTLYRNFGKSFENHVAHIETCNYDVWYTRAVMYMHNVHTFFNMIVEQRSQMNDRVNPCLEEARESNPEWFFMNLAPYYHTFIFEKISSDGAQILERVCLHPLILQVNPMGDATLDLWKRRSNLEEVKGTSNSCVICMEEFHAEELTVLSDCRHLCCISCSERWFAEKGVLECVLCRTVSRECMRGAGYLSLVNKGVFGRMA